MTDKTDIKERDLQRIAECAARLVEHADFQLGGVLSADSKARDIPSRACSQVKARHLAALRDALAGRASLAASAGSEPVAPPPLQHFESPRAKILMRAWQEGWGACRDAEYVGEDAQNDAFNQSSTVNHCVAEDILYTHPSPPEGMVGGWQDIATAPRDGSEVLANTAGLGRIVVYWDDDESQWGTGLGYLHRDAPTHWIPLPPPPTTSAGSGKGE